MSVPSPFTVSTAAVGPEAAPFLAPLEADGRFGNPWGVGLDKGLLDVLRWRLLAPDPLRAAKRGAPPAPAHADPSAAWAAQGDGPAVQWLGHASLRVRIDGVTLLIDPVFGRAGPVVPRLVAAPLLPDALGPVDAVVVTHGHFDHLDVPSLRALAARHGRALPVILPRGLGAALPPDAGQPIECTWWQGVRIGAVEAVLVPAQHWHRRGPFDTNRALWGGVVLRGSRSVYHSGDTGYFGGFATIGQVFPGLDLAVLPLGAWAPRWFMAPQHMDPAGTVQAFRDLGARRFLGMHWGTFDLTDEPPCHGPAEELPRALDALEVPHSRACLLPIGGALRLDADEPPPPLFDGWLRGQGKPRFPP